MEKVINPGSWDFGIQAAEMVKISSKGLINHDLSSLVKRAGADFADKVKHIKLAKDQIPVHLIAMGATEAYGPNRNGDGFKEAALKDHHPTFVKFAKHYRHHKNKDPDKSYGQVKASHYNEHMRRVELLVALNGTKEAAEKHGGFVADKELEKLESGKDLPVSMACKIAYDVCSGCGNKAKTRKEYCTDDTCRYGGCKDNLTKVAADGHILHVDNPHPTFFDISSVFRPADRIAYGTTADYLQKAASGEILGGAALAEAFGIVPPLAVALSQAPTQKLAHQIKLAYSLAEQEDAYQYGASNELARAFSRQVQDSVDLSPLGDIGTVKFASGLSALANQKIVLPLRDFLRLTLDEGSEKYATAVDEVPLALPGVYNRLISSGDLEGALWSNPYAPSQGLAPAIQRTWAQKLAEDLSLDRTLVRRRAAKSAIYSFDMPTVLHKVATDQAEWSGGAETLAHHYALYKLAFLACQDQDVPLTTELIVMQNQVN